MGWPKHPGDPQAHRELAARHLAVVQERDALKAELAALRSRPREKSVEELSRALRKYGKHDEECNSISLTMSKHPVPNGRPCSCGLAFLLDEEAGRVEEDVTGERKT